MRLRHVSRAVVLALVPALALAGPGLREPGAGRLQAPLQLRDELFIGDLLEP